MDIIKTNPKLGRGGALTLQGYGELKARFIAYKNLVHSFGLDLVLIVHSDEQRNGDDVIERLDVTGGSKNEIYKSADLMGRILIRAGKRVLTFNPTDTAFGKNPAALPEFEVPHFAQDGAFLAKIIANTKAALNKLSDQQQQAANALANWQAKFEEGKTAEDFNKLAVEVRDQASAEVKENAGRLLTKTAKGKGFALDKTSKQFVKAPEKVAA